MPLLYAPFPSRVIAPEVAALTQKSRRYEELFLPLPQRASSQFTYIASAKNCAGLVALVSSRLAFGTRIRRLVPSDVGGFVGSGHGYTPVYGLITYRGP